MVKNNINKDVSFLNDVSVVLVNPLYQGNVGAIARSMANFGFSKLVIVGDFKIEEEARNRAKHANYILDNALFVSCFEDARNLFDLVIGTSGVVGTDYNLPRSPLLIGEVLDELSGFSGVVGLFFGPEDRGLSNDELIKCDFSLNIPCSKNYGVLNLSHAATIIFYEFFRFFSLKTIRDGHVLASVREKDVVYNVVEGIIKGMSFKSESDRETQFVLWRRVLGKSFLTKREVSSLIGFFRNVDYSLNNSKKK